MSGQDYVDDASISADDFLLRRVIVEPEIWVAWDPKQQRWRPSSAAFDDDKEGAPMSVALASELARLGRPLESVIEGHDDRFELALAGVRASEFRARGQIIIRDPTPDEPAHALVIGPKPQSARSKWAKCAEWIVDPGLDPRDDNA